eukprot:Pompholyxophrys_punicea_v1_NODE_142_length_3244_cov_9.803700.p3 type:complete len:111 gc:universal NODE_142_length_3244_cov_9.803700:812-1144(+)
MLHFKSSQFTGSFEANCQTNSVPESLKMLVACVLGLDIKGEAVSQAQLTISQLLFFNASMSNTEDPSNVILVQENLLFFPLYMGLKLHSMFRSEQLIKFLLFVVRFECEL